MKKTIIILSIVVMLLSLIKSNTIIIPKESIRFRIIANSNNKKDQEVKKQLVANLSKEINNIEYNSNNIINSREVIRTNIPKFRHIIHKTITDLNYQDKYNINYGMNYFPEKEYKGTIYPEGEYESLVITLGDGLGENFWCVLFPPLCLLETEDNSTDDIEYSSLVQEIINKYF